MLSWRLDSSEACNWTKPVAKGDTPSARSDFAVAAHGKKLYLFGGNADDELKNDLYCLDMGMSDDLHNKFVDVVDFALGFETSALV